MPACVALACLGLGLGLSATTVALLFLAQPTASSSFIMAWQLGGDAPLMATITAVRTVRAGAAIPFVLGLAFLLVRA